MVREKKDKSNQEQLAKELEQELTLAEINGENDSNAIKKVFEKTKGDSSLGLELIDNLLQEAVPDLNQRLEEAGLELDESLKEYL